MVRAKQADPAKVRHSSAHVANRERQADDKRAGADGGAVLIGSAP